MSDTSKERLATMSDNDLQGEIDLNEIKRKSLERSLAWLNEETAAFKAEQDRRNLDRFWKDNPTLLRLEVGDKLTIYEGHEMLTRPIGYKAGDIGTIIGFKDRYAHIQWHGGDSMLTLEIASDLRRAWLQQQGETT